MEIFFLFAVIDEITDWLKNWKIIKLSSLRTDILKNL